MIARNGVLVISLLSGACSMNVSVGGEGRPCSPDTPCGPNTTCIDSRCVKTLDARSPDDHGLSDSPRDGGKQLDTASDALRLDRGLDTAGADLSKPDSKVVCDAGAHPVSGKCLFRPSNTKTLVYPPGAVAKLTLTTGNTTFDTTTGKITASDGTVLRAAGTGTLSGIGFTHVSQGAPAPEIGVFQLQSLSVSQGATLRGVGDNALMLWVAGDISVSGVIDVKASKGEEGPGGGSGSIGGDSGPGGGKMVTISGCDVGGGGGGFGAVGGTGGAEDGTTTCSVNPAGGVVYGNGSLVPLYGGSAGASGVNGTTPKGGGGGGGGALQIAADGSCTLLATGTVDAGGGGGPGVANGGGGGGSGGGILIEAPVVALSGVVAANGGGGGGGGDASTPGTNGSNALASTTAAAGGTGKTEAGLGPGNGGSGGALSGSAKSGELGDSGGGGGGAVGRIAIRSASGSYSGTPTISPAPVKGVIPP